MSNVHPGDRPDGDSRGTGSVPPPLRAHPGFVGKLPHAPDFIRDRAFCREYARFEGWLADGMDALHRTARGGGGQPPTLDGGTFAFVWSPPEAPLDGLLAGVIRPSRDSVGRPFPAAIVARIDPAPLLTAPHLAPLWLGEFWGWGAEIADAYGGATSAQLVDGITANRFALRAPEVAPVGAYAEWGATCPPDGLFEAIYGSADPVPPIAAIHAILEAARPFAGHQHPDTPLGIRVPLGRYGTTAVAFWIDVMRRSAGWSSTIPSFFWSHDGATGALLVQLGPPQLPTLSTLFSENTPPPHLCDLTCIDGPFAFGKLGPLPPPLACWMAAPSTTVSGLLDAVSASFRSAAP